MRFRLKALLAAPVLALTLTAPTPAHAEVGWLRICNSSLSRGPIKIIDRFNATANKTLITDRCHTIYDTGDRIRIDPDPELGGDVGSTWWAYQWQDGYPYCINGENLINPPAYYADEIYYNTDASGC